jgi:arylsulfatase A-like enzyme
VSPVPARHVDIVPTLLDAVGVARPHGLPGRSLLPDAPAVDERDVTSYFEAMSAMLNRGWAPLSGVLAGREKFIDLPRPELYDLASDPN